jgi:hypothetical protein
MAVLLARLKSRLGFPSAVVMAYEMAEAPVA